MSRGFSRLVVVLVVTALVGCAGARGPAAEEPSFRVSDVAGTGDPARRASMRFVLRGLDDDARGQHEAAVSRFDRALQVDPNNPYAYLALARHEIEVGDPARAITYLDKVDALLPAEGESSRGAELHSVGLRGAALRASGRPREAAPLLERARLDAPRAWWDAKLDAAELR